MTLMVQLKGWKCTKHILESEMPKQVKINGEANVSIPVKTIVSILAVVGITVAGYDQITNRILALETSTVLMLEEIEENDHWIDTFALPLSVEDSIERVRDLERRVAIIETIIKHRNP